MHDDTGENEDYSLPDDEEFKTALKEAQEAGEDYVYYDNQWIKVDHELLDDFHEAKELQNKIKDSNKGKVNKEHLKQILDIYENTERLWEWTNRKITGHHQRIIR